MKRITLKNLIADRQIFLPGVYDCISARAVEISGYQAMLLSSMGVAYSWCGLPDIGLLNADEILWFASRITDYIKLPLVVSMDFGYQNSNTIYRTVQRLVKAGVDSVIIDDTDDHCGRDRGSGVSVISEQQWIGRVRAAKEAMSGTDGMVIARTGAKYKMGLAEAEHRCNVAIEAGADMTSIAGLDGIKEARDMAEKVSGNFMWSDLRAKDGQLEATPEELKELRFSLISIYYTEKASMFGMLDFAKQNLKNGNTVYHDQHDFDGMLKLGEDYHKFFSFHKTWVPMEQEFMDVKELCELPDFVKR